MTTRIGEIITEKRTEIIEHWESEAKKSVSASGLSRSEVLNLVPVYLSSLAQQVSVPTYQECIDQKRLIDSHLSTRLRQGFNVHEIIEEFVALGRCISQTWLMYPPASRPD